MGMFLAPHVATKLPSPSKIDLHVNVAFFANKTQHPLMVHGMDRKTYQDATNTNIVNKEKI